jgi:tripartite-type tricarboxylate transporter receptor subunit TctC
MKKLVCLASVALFALMPGLSAGQTFPAKPIKILVGFAPGGAPDILARIVARKLSENTGQTVVVENRAGAAGNIAAQAVARSDPDGYTLLMSTVSVAISAGLPGSLPFSPARDFEPVSMVASVPLVLVVRPDLGVDTVKDLLAHARANPGKLNYASVGNGTPQHLSGELFQLLGSVKMVHIPYKGGGPATQAVLAGETSIFFAGMPPAMPFIRSGRLKALAVTSSKRSAAAPEIPTVSEAGLAGFEADNWHALYAPKGTPAAVVAKLNSELQRVLAAADVREQMLNQGAEVWASSPQEAREYLQAEIAKWARVVATAGVKAE